MNSLAKQVFGRSEPTKTIRCKTIKMRGTERGGNITRDG